MDVSSRESGSCQKDLETSKTNGNKSQRSATKFSNSIKLNSHKLDVNKDQKTSNTFECEVCKRKMKRKYHLERHILRMHSKIKNFKCENCHKSFYIKEDLKTHTNHVHDGHVYKCNVCGKNFSNSSNLKTHKLNLHEYENISDF